MLSALPARWLALAFLLLALALVFGNPILLAGSVFVLLIVLLGTLLTPPGGIEVEREMTRLVCWAGDRLEVRRRVHVKSGLGTLYVHDELPAEMEVVEGNNFRAVWKWPGPKTYDLSYEFLCPKRGLYELGETLWDTEGALGLQRRNRGTAGETQEFSVVPRIQAVRRVKEVRARAHTRFFRTDVATQGPSTTDFKDLRPYSPGDPMRIVNWKASARNSYSANPLLVNQYEAEGRKAIWIFLDGAEYMEVGTTLSSLIDHAVEAAGSIAQYYLSQGYTLGAYIYNTPNDILTPDLGRKQFKRLTDMLTTLQPGPARQDLSAAVEWCKSFLYRLQPEVYAITRLDVHYPRDGNQAQSIDGFVAGIKRLVALRSRTRRLNPVRVVHVEAAGVRQGEAALEARTQDLMRWEARQLYKPIREVGASVVSWDPAEQDFTTTLMQHIYLGA